MSDWYDAHGDQARAASLLDAWKNECRSDSANANRSASEKK